MRVPICVSLYKARWPRIKILLFGRFAMELKCVLVLALVHIVTAYPHGYGVKGGAGTAAKGGS